MDGRYCTGKGGGGAGGLGVLKGEWMADIAQVRGERRVCMGFVGSYRGSGWPGVLGVLGG